MIDQLQLQPEGLLVRRKRPRHYSLLFRAVLMASVFLPKATAAFTPSSIAGPSHRRNLISLTNTRPSKASKKTYNDDAADEVDPRQNWLQWMLEGARSRGTQKVSLVQRARSLAVFMCNEQRLKAPIFFRTLQVMLREAVELGGVPRSDRYSSRDWFHNTLSLPNSAILRDIRSPVICKS